MNVCARETRVLLFPQHANCALQRISENHCASLLSLNANGFNQPYGA